MATVIWWLVGWPLLWLAMLALLGFLSRDPEHQHFLRKQAWRRRMERREKRTKALLRRIK